MFVLSHKDQFYTIRKQIDGEATRFLGELFSVDGEFFRRTLLTMTYTEEKHCM